MKESPKRSTPSPLPTNNIREMPKRYSPLPTKTVKDLDSNSQKSREVPKGPRNRKIKTFQVARIDRKPQFKSKRHRRKIYDEFFGTTTKYIRRMARRGGVQHIIGLIYEVNEEQQTRSKNLSGQKEATTEQVSIFDKIFWSPNSSCSNVNLCIEYVYKSSRVHLSI